MKRSSIIALVVAACLAAPGPIFAQEKPADYGSIASYPVPARGGRAELDYCYRYSKRVWELVMGQPINAPTLTKLTRIVAEALGKNGAAEDTAEIKKYFSGGYKTREEMAGARFYACGERLKLPLKPEHRKTAELCYSALNLPSYVAAAKSNNRTAEQTLEELKGTNPSSTHAGIDKTVSLIYSKTDEDVDGLLKDAFLACIVQLEENSK